VTASYSGDSRGHTVGEVDAGSVTVVLDDNSRWQVYQGFADVIAGWHPGEMVTIKPNRDPEYPYKLVNVHKNQSVEARYQP
jgi:hypothetical protein